MSCCATAFSKIFERNGRFDTGRLVFLYFLGQGLAFSREALLLPLLVSVVHIRWIGEPFIIFNIGGPSTGSSFFSSLVGIGSSMQLEGLEAMIYDNL